MTRNSVRGLGGDETTSGRTCAGPGCSNPLPPPATTGRPRSYCSKPCRYRARRRRLADEAQPLAELIEFPTQELPPDPWTVRRRLAAAIGSAIRAAEPTDPIDQLAAALLELDTLCAVAEANLPRLPSRQADRLEKLIAQVRSARHQLFPIPGGEGR